jgi:hypothetical protein
MRHIRGKLCQTEKGRFTRCRGKVKGKRKSKSKRRCRLGVVKTGPRKGLCRKVRRARK